MISAIVNGPIFTGEELLNEHAVIIENGQIKELILQAQLSASITQRFDLQGNTLAPGFIDLQVNGGGGIMFNSAPSVETIRQMSAAHQQFGTTGFMPTLITDNYDAMKGAISAVEQAIEEGVPGVLGIHLEGPFLSEVKKGAHDASKFCAIDEQGFAIVTSMHTGKTLITIAPELTESDTITKLKAAGVIICAGHSNANYEQTITAIEAGLHGFTHLYNAMTPLLSREPGMVGAALSSNNTWFGIIADGFHMHPSAFKVAVNAKQRGGAILVTDAMATVGSEQDYFVLDNEVIKAVNGKCENAAGSLAGSALDMNTAVKNAALFAELDWQEAVRMATLYPAQALGLEQQIGLIKPGFNANFVALNTELDVQQVWTNGSTN
ncbi:MAG: N-acetylglucosamine-6-phosphate deacetylase [Pseudoalteromonas nigrifaciens]|uniref:N-acetylglucosamine-6-phosphate deacetylase n=1 Tax=Pseudoalteromonas nigrifaciens TaxID=28109 RepID=UPI003F94777D